MSSLIFPLIGLGLLLIFGVIFLVYTKNQQKKNSIDEEKKSQTSSKGKKNQTNQDVKKEDVFKFMEFDRILNNMIVQEKGTKFTMAIKCKGINYDLMSDIEQISVEEGFITFLNTLRYPIQLYVQAQNIDLKEAINTYKSNVRGVRDEYEEINKEYTNLVDQFDAKKEDVNRVEEKRNRVLNVYEYAADIINYVERLSLNKNLLQRNFYVLVSYYSNEITSSEQFSKEEIINICYNELLTRAQAVIGGLATCSVNSETLDSNQLADLLYTAYNRDDKGLLNVREAIESGFYRLYSTSEDVFMKKQEKLQEEIKKESEIRAYEAIKEALDKGTYITQEAEKLDLLEDVSKAASEVVKNENIPDEIKDKAQSILVDGYVEEKNKILSSYQNYVEGEIQSNKSENGTSNDTVENVKEEKKEIVDNSKKNNVEIETEIIKKQIDELPNDNSLDDRLDDRFGYNSNESADSNSSSNEDELII